jgi:hypothetical protein
VDYHQTNQKIDTGKTLTRWPVFVDHFTESRNHRLIDKPDLKSAMDYWHNQAMRMDLTGAYSPHSLRYAWAQNAIHLYLAQGFSRKETLAMVAMVAMDLGHGDGRGRYVAQVYGQDVYFHNP